MKSIEEIIKSTTFLTDGGLETDLVFLKNIDLPHFAAFPLLDHPVHRQTLRDYYIEYLDIAKENRTGFILESPTWRANEDWGFKLGYDKDSLKRVNQDAIKLLSTLKTTYADAIQDILISGQIGPRGDGYQIETIMTPEGAREYHSLQVEAFKKAGADMISAITMTNTNEALGIVLAAKENKVPVVISFTVETDGKLPNGDSLEEAIYKLDNASDDYPSYYMINCAHPTHFIKELEADSDWKLRIKGLRANASCKSHEELDASTSLDAGNPQELGQLHADLKKLLPGLKVFGGCCGTDASHVSVICAHVLTHNSYHGF